MILNNHEQLFYLLYLYHLLNIVINIKYINKITAIKMALQAY